MEGVGQFFQLSFSCACTVLRCAKESIISVLEVNYDVVSTAIIYISVCLDMLSRILNIASVVFVNIFSAFFDFVLECSHFFSAFFTLLWKFSLLVISFLNLIFRCLEQFCYCLWSGGIWTLETVTSSWLNLKFTSINLYEAASSFIYNLFSSIYGGLHLVGYFTVKGFISLYYATKLLFITAWELLDDSMDLFDRSVRYVTNNVYFFLTKFIPGLSKEAYLGVLICTITYFFIVNLYNILSTRGMTFPFFSRPEYNYWNENRRQRNRRYGMEFSDDEVEMSDNEIVESDAETYLTDEDDDDIEDIDDENIDSDDDENSDDETENDDTSSNESDATTNSNDIDIQLPPADARYNLRRSVTPSRTKQHDPDELARAVEHEREKQKCVVCQDEHKSVLILPCRHMCLCVNCGNKIARSKNVDRRICPLCRQRIRTIMNVYT